MDDKAAIKADFDKLQREYRNMEAMRKLYAEESLSIIKKQRDTIEKLQTENDDFKAKIDMEKRFTRKKNISDPQLVTLHDQIKMYKEKLSVEKKNAEQLYKQVKKLRTLISEKRRNMGGVNAAKENHAMIQKQIRILENRLDKALIKFNEALAFNRELRQEIDNLRQERVVFDNIYRKLEKDLQQRKQDMAEVIERSNKAYETRDRAQIETVQIQTALTKRRAEHDKILEDLERKIEEDAEEGFDASDEEDGGASTDMETISKGSATVSAQRMEVQRLIAKMNEYRDAFKRIESATGISDVDELVKMFQQNEETNYSLFNFVAEQNNEMERLEEQLAALKEEEAKFHQESGEDAIQHKELISDLESRLVATKASAEKYEARFTEAQRTVKSLTVGIQSIFSKLKCDETIMKEMLADSSVTENNMMQYLGMIEQRTNEILQMYATLQEIKQAEKAKSRGRREVKPAAEEGGTFLTNSSSQALASLLGQGPQVQHGTERVHPMELPKLTDYSSESDDSEDDTETRPLTMKELQDRTISRLTTRTKGRRRK